MFKKITTILAAIAISSLSAFSPLAKANAANDVNDFYFKDFSADYYLWRDDAGLSHMRVVEELTAVFPHANQNRGIRRVIPFTNNNGKNLTMASDDSIAIRVERNGKEEPVNKVEISDGYFEVYIGSPDTYVNGEQTYTLVYDFQNVILDQSDNFKSWQELYWDANGNDWSQPFGRVTASVYLDPEIASNFNGETACYVGYYNSNNQNRCTITEFTEEVDLDNDFKTMSGIKFTASNLSAMENLTFVIGFDAATFKIAPQKVSQRFVIATITLSAIGVGIILLMVKCYSATKDKRRYYKNLFVKPEYTPVKDITVAEMAENYIGKGRKGDIRVATLLDMAVNHKIEIVKAETDGLFGKKKTGWKIIVKANVLNVQQATVLKILAGRDEPLQVDQEIVVKSHRATSTLTSLLTRFTESIKNNLIKKGLAIDSSKKKTDQATTKPPHNWSNTLLAVSAIWFIGGVILAMIIFIDTPSYITAVGEEILPLVYSAILITIFIASLIIGGKTSLYFSHTEKGLEYSRYLEGLKMYMEMAETDRLKMLQSVKGADTTHEGVVKLYEKLLPYAILFKLEESWLKELSRYYEFEDVSTPTWYIGMGTFSAHEFSAAMLAASSSMSSTITHSTTTSSSSGSSGFSGGGFSGGGGGGGGGGGW